MIQKFEVHIAQHVLDEVTVKLQHTRWPDEITNSGWQYGADLAYMKELTDYWINRFDWRKTEQAINSYDNFTAHISGYDIHFMYCKGNGPSSIPLLITHGWPYSFLEMFKIIPLLTGNHEISFDLIIPSMLGYGFSQKITHPGCNVSFMADLWVQIMKELGYERFGVQGGDFGAGVSTAIAMKYPENLIGMHLNYIPGNYEPVLSEDEKFSNPENEFLEADEEWYHKEGGYSLQQRTKPLTLAYSLNDSPVGLCAWIIEKMYGWAECNGDIERVFTKDELLSNVMLYWVTETIHSSIRLYNENRKSPLRLGKDTIISIPVGIAHFRYEEPFPPRAYIERGFKIQHWTDFEKGGHFPAIEQPELLTDDIIRFFKQL